MGTVGLNFGSATSGAGFDVASTVTAILGAQQAIEAPLKSQLTSLQAQDTVFSTLGSDLSTLTSTLQALTDATGILAEKKGSSSNPSVLTLSSANTNAIAGSHNIIVNSLAITASTFSNVAIPATDTIGGSITINGTAVSVVTGVSDTLSTFAAAINQAALGVTANIISDATGSRLSIVSNTPGAAGSVGITANTLADSTNSAAITFSTPIVGSNAALFVDGVSISSASNTVSGAIPGVTFQILSSPGTSVQVIIANDNSAIESAISDLATAYNTVISDIQGQEKNDAAGKPEPLFGNPTLNLLQSQLQAAIYGGAASGSIHSIGQLGISIGTDGKLTVDNSALDAALNSHFFDISGFFQNSGSFGQTFSVTLNNLGTASVHGAVSLAQQENSAIEANITKSISTQDAFIAQQKTALTAELNAANQILQAIPQQLSQLSQIYSAISGYNQKF